MSWGEFCHGQPMGELTSQTFPTGQGAIRNVLLKNDQTGEAKALSLTDYQAKYYAHELTSRFPPDSEEKVTVAFAGAQVDLNPHQIDAALFAFKSPLSRGALLFDEVGLGKTIEAGLVLSQKWAERKRRIFIITPSSSIYGSLAQHVGFGRCTDDAFQKLRTTLRAWFHVPD